MKKLTVFIILSLFTFSIASSQGCLPEGIEFTTQAQIDSFQVNYPGCTEIEGNIGIQGDDISNLDSLIDLTAIWGSLCIKGNDSLTSITGLEGLTTINLFFCLKSNPSLTSLSGLDNLTNIGGDFEIVANYKLTNFEGLEGLTTVGLHFSIQINDSLTNLMGLENLSSIGGTLGIGGSDQFGDYGNKSLISLSGLEGLTSIGGNLVVGLNTPLSSITGLSNITSIAGDVYIYGHDSLTSLAGLENIDAGTIEDLSIWDNPLLSTCDVQSICDYLVAPNGTVAIENNAPGCNSPEEVEEACLTGVNESNTNTSLTIHPNPSDNGSITITLENTHSDLHLSCFNTYGQQVYSEEVHGTETMINVADWKSGIYLAVVYDDGKPVGRAKFIVQ